MLDFMCFQYWCILLSGKHSRIYQIFFYVPIWWGTCGFDAFQQSSISYSLYLFLFCTLKHSSIRRPTLHSLHFSNILFDICHVKHVQEFSLAEWIALWLLKLILSWVSYFFTKAGLSRGWEGQDKLPAFSVKFCMRVIQKFLCVIKRHMSGGGSCWK